MTGRVAMRIFERGLLLVGLLVAGAGAMAAEPTTAPVKLDIAAQAVGDALNDFARQSGLQVVMDPKEGGDIKTPRVAGTYTPDAALSKLLADTGLQYKYLNERTVAVRLAKIEKSDETLKADVKKE